MSDLKKKILIVTTSLGQGGAERASATQSFVFTNLGYDVYIVTILSDITYKYSGTLINLGALKDKNDSTIGRIHRLLEFRKLLNQYEFSLIVDNRARNQSYREFIISKLIYNCPVVYVIHSYDEKVAFTSYQWLNRFLYKNETMVAVSDKVADKFRNKYGLNCVETIHNGFDFASIDEHSKKDVINEYSGDYILYYGRIHDHSKNLRLLLQSYLASELVSKNIKLIIAGDGPDTSAIQEYSSELGLRDDVIFKGFMKNPFPLVKKACFTVLTSRSEGFALTLVESLFLETPVVSVDCEAGPKEIIEHEVNGLLVENHNVKALSEGMRRMVKDLELRQKCIQNAKQSVMRFDLVDKTEAWKKLSDEMMR